MHFMVVAPFVISLTQVVASLLVLLGQLRFLSVTRNLGVLVGRVLFRGFHTLTECNELSESLFHEIKIVLVHLANPRLGNPERDDVDDLVGGQTLTSLEGRQHRQFFAIDAE